MYNYSLEDFEEYFLSIDEKKYTASQMFDWLYKKRVKSFNDMTNIKKELREKLSNKFSFSNFSILKKQQAKDVNKYLFELEDGNKIEAVLMKQKYGNSLCVSTQIGCNMGCEFCASGILKKVRDLTAGEMVQQILLVEEDLKARVSHVVMMGIGEPFDNYKNVMKFIRIINSSKGLEIGARHITISTCGLIPKINKFIDEGIQVNLAVSLHASNDVVRNKIMPINKTYNINDLVDSIKQYINKTNRRVTFEYMMLDGINDNVKYANELSDLLRGVNCYVNLIPYNEIGNDLKRSSKEKITTFYETLQKRGINVTIRKEYGEEIDAACGQLRAEC